MDAVDLKRLTINVYPKSADCLNNKNADGEVVHLGEEKYVFFEDVQEDDIDLLIIGRCSHCGVPLGYEDYANYENKQRYAAGLSPYILLQ